MTREPNTIPERVAWAIQHSGRTLQDLASAMGCTHATLSQWQTGATDVRSAKVGLVVSFADETGVSLDWLLTGDGARITRFGRLGAPLVLLAEELAADHGFDSERAERVLRALRTSS